MFSEKEDDSNRKGIGVRLGATTGDLARNMKSLQVSRSVTPEDGVVSRTLTKVTPIKKENRLDNINLRNAKFDKKNSQENQLERDDSDGCENKEVDQDHANRPTMSGKKSATRTLEREQK